VTRGDFFLSSLQTLVASGHLGVKVNPSDTADMLDAAAQLDPAAFGGEANVARAALAFGLWHRKWAAKPEWLEAWHEAMHNRVQIRAGNPARDWWLLADGALQDTVNGVGLPLPPGTVGLLQGVHQGIVVSRQHADQFRAWVEAIPGWQELPFLFEEVAAGGV
jgi:hypothetical protein